MLWECRWCGFCTYSVNAQRKRLSCNRRDNVALGWTYATIKRRTKNQTVLLWTKEITNIAECQKFCDENDIEYHVVDVKEIYKKEVLEYFKNEYRNGRTPNPCIRCNRLVKFGALLEGVKKLGIEYDYFCTGHYAKIVRPEKGVFGSDIKPCMIAGAEDVSKDQTYFLYRIPSEILEKVRFPLATMKKSEVFRIAQEANLQAASREESQDFIGEEYFELIFSDKPSVPGDIIDLDGKVLGHHRGIEHYTVGQRRALGVAVGYPVYVHSIKVKYVPVEASARSGFGKTASSAKRF